MPPKMPSGRGSLRGALPAGLLLAVAVLCLRDTLLPLFCTPLSLLLMACLPLAAAFLPALPALPLLPLLLPLLPFSLHPLAPLSLQSLSEDNVAELLMLPYRRRLGTGLPCTEEHVHAHTCTFTHTG